MNRLEAFISVLLPGCRDWRTERNEIDIFDPVTDDTDQECDLRYSPKPLCMPPRPRPQTVQVTDSSPSASSSETEESLRRAIEAGPRLFHLPRVVDGVRILSDSLRSVSDDQSEKESVASEGPKARHPNAKCLTRPHLTAYNTRHWWKRVIRLA